MKLKLLPHSISLASLLLLSACQQEHATNTNAQLPPITPPAISIVPAPVSAEMKTGQFVFGNSTQFTVNSEKLRDVAQLWADFFNVASGINLQVQSATGNSDKTNTVSLELVPASEFSSSNAEAYELTVTDRAITVRASTSAGIFYGLTSLRQLLPPQIESPSPINSVNWVVPAVAIVDEPLYPYRGMHLDVSRHFFDVNFIKRYIDILALHKMNRFHWHLTDDQGWRIPIDAYPLLTEKSAWRDKTVIGHTYDRDVAYNTNKVGGYYSKDQIRDIVAYAAERKIMVIPEIDIPGHAAAILHAYPEFGCIEQDSQVQSNFGIFEQVLCPTEPTFEFLRAVFTEVAELFPGEYLHIGGDEVKKVQWQQSPFVTELMQREGLKDYHEVQSYFIRRVGEIVSSLDKKMLGWNEILDGGIAPNATIMSWQGIEGGIAAAELGHDAIMSPGNYVYFDHFQSRSVDEPLAIHGITPLSETYSYNPMPEQFAGTEKAKHILGAQGQLWTEYVPTTAKAEYMILPRLSAVAEITWTPVNKQSWQSFSERLPNLFARFDEMGLNAARSVYAITATAKTEGSGEDAKYRVNLATDTAHVIIRYTTDGTLPNAQSPIYSQPFLVEGDTFVRARSQDKISGDFYLESQLRTVKHKAVGAQLTLLSEANTEWNKDPVKTLSDGITSIDQIFQLDDWATFFGDEVIANITFANPQTVKEVSIGFNPGKHRQMYPPTRLHILSSSDGETWQSLGEADPQHLATAKNRVSYTFAPTTTRHLRIEAENKTRVLSTESGKLKSVPLYLDEIIVK